MLYDQKRTADGEVDNVCFYEFQVLCCYRLVDSHVRKLFYCAFMDSCLLVMGALLKHIEINSEKLLCWYSTSLTTGSRKSVLQLAQRISIDIVTHSQYFSSNIL